MHNDIDKNYTNGSLLSGIGCFLMALLAIGLEVIRGYNGIELWPVLCLLAGLIVSLIIAFIGVDKKMPKGKNQFSKNTIHNYFDEQDLALLNKSKSYGYSFAVTILGFAYLMNFQEGQLSLVWIQLAFFGSLATSNFCYYFYTKDAYDEE